MDKAYLQSYQVDKNLKKDLHNGVNPVKKNVSNHSCSVDSGYNSDGFLSPEFIDKPHQNESFSKTIKSLALTPFITKNKSM